MLTHTNSRSFFGSFFNAEFDSCLNILEGFFLFFRSKFFWKAFCFGESWGFVCCVVVVAISAISCWPTIFSKFVSFCFFSSSSQAILISLLSISFPLLCWFSFPISSSSSPRTTSLLIATSACFAEWASAVVLRESTARDAAAARSLSSPKDLNFRLLRTHCFVLFCLFVFLKQK